MSAYTMQYLVNEVRKLQKQTEKLYKMLESHLAAHYNKRIEFGKDEPEEDEYGSG